MNARLTVRDSVLSSKNKIGSPLIHSSEGATEKSALWQTSPRKRGGEYTAQHLFGHRSIRISMSLRTTLEKVLGKGEMVWILDKELTLGKQ